MKTIEKCDEIIRQKGYLYNLYKTAPKEYFMQLFWKEYHLNTQIEIESDNLKILFNKAVKKLEDK